MWTVTRETRLELAVDGGIQVFHHLVFHKQLDATTTLRLNIHSLNDKRKALVHLHNQITSRLLHEEEADAEALELFVRKMKAKSDDLLENPKKARMTSKTPNWIWELVDSELSEFGTEESWVVRWRNKANPKLRPIQLQINWFKGNLPTIPSFASIEIVRKDANNFTDLHYVELPVNSCISSLDAKQSIESKVEDLLLTPMDMLHRLLVCK